MAGFSTLSSTWVSRLFPSVFLIFVDLGGRGERSDICCSVLTCITVKRRGDLVSVFDLLCRNPI